LAAVLVKLAVLNDLHQVKIYEGSNEPHFTQWAYSTYGAVLT
jgi:hypothetical protein